MKKQLKLAFLASLVLSLAFTLSTPVLAVPANNGNANIDVPQVAVDNSVVIDLGTAVDPQTGNVVQGLKFIYKKGNAKPDNPGGGNGGGNGGGGKDKGGSTCFAYIAKGAAWKTVEDFVVNTSNTQNISSADVFAIVDDNVTEWEDAADGTPDGDIVNIFGTGSITTDDLSAKEDTMDGRNGVYFGNADSSNTIGATTVWGIFSGPPRGRELVEWDMELNQVNFTWNTDGSAGDMDLENIMAHELGHAFGMGHPDSTCTDETMYAFAATAETKKRDLFDGDIAGIDGLY